MSRSYQEMDKKFVMRKTLEAKAGGYRLVFEELPADEEYQLRVAIEMDSAAVNAAGRSTMERARAALGRGDRDEAVRLLDRALQAPGNVAELFFTAEEWEDFRDTIDDTRFRVTVATKKPKREELAQALPKDAPREGDVASSPPRPF